MNPSKMMPRIPLSFRPCANRPFAVISNPRFFSSTATRSADARGSSPDTTSAPSKREPQKPLENQSEWTSSRPAESKSTESPRQTSGLGSLASLLNGSATAPRTDFLQDILKRKFGPSYDEIEEVKPHQMHILSHKHNTHITVTDPQGNACKGLSVSTGNIGFKKANRGTYEAAYQLMNFVITRMRESGLLAKIEKIDIFMRGFGQGRDAAKAILIGQEGQSVRPKISAVADSTRVKFGGVRGKRPRRLG